jgi:hypothetical protein
MVELTCWVVDAVDAIARGMSECGKYIIDKVGRRRASNDTNLIVILSTALPYSCHLLQFSRLETNELSTP